MLYFAPKLAPRTLDNEMATRLDNRKGLQPSVWLERRFRLSLRDTSVATEFRAAVATFMVMAYIIFANAGILGTLADSRGESLAFPAVLTVTCLSAGCLCILMGLFANVPFALAPGMGLNAVVTFQLVGQMKLTWPQAMTIVFVEGTLILLLVLTRFREAVMNAIPLSQKRAIGAGIGMFIALIGFVNSGLVVQGKGTVVALGSPSGLRMIVFVIGFLVMGWLLVRRVPGALVMGILMASLAAVALNLTFGQGRAFGAAAVLPTHGFGLGYGLRGEGAIFGRLDFEVFRKLGLPTAAMVIFSVMLSDFFDTMGTAVALGQKAGFIDRQGKFRGIHRVLLVDSLGAIFGGFCNSSSNTLYIESAAGISEGGRTGLTAVFVGLFFVSAILLSPVASVIPAEATAPSLILVGLMMMTIVQDIPWTSYEEAIPAFVTLLLMPFTYSITNGIGAGFIAYTLLKLTTGKVRELHPLLLLAATAFLVYFCLPIA
jgi:AGZA family xanthine/uracil permease-like MFS transporter